jgi:uncharacterized ferritin-like protein (DUF455 family)
MLAGVEVREFALSVLRGTSLEAKLSAPPRGLTDRRPGPALRLEAPGRPPHLLIVPSYDAKVPAIEGMNDPAQRPRIVHAFANHELQAAELYAWALLAFPEAPPAFRSGALRILGDEQRHARLYCARLGEWGVELGDYPVSGYFWSKAGDFTTPLRFVCAMSLTFENANLDHTEEYALAARAAGDERTAAIIDLVRHDEVEHVRFGWRWLEALKEAEESPWEAYCRSLRWPLRPALGRGESFHPSGREAAGLDPDFVRRLGASDRDLAPGAGRAPGRCADGSATGGGPA